jgi:predicted SnoaL-like aldol condensation-catalyzing enzyme
VSEQNKQIVCAFLEKTFNQFDPANAIAQHGGKYYRQHDPIIEDGFEGMSRFIFWIRDHYPRARVHLKRVLAEGDLVVAHSNWVRVPGERGEAVVDIFRLENGKIVEHWDVVQPVPETSFNNNTMF